MTRIYKYRLAIIERQIVRMPEQSSIRAVMMQDGVLCVWAEVETDSPPADRVFRIMGTGHQVPDVSSLNYLDSVIDGGLVWHVYEALPRVAAPV